MSDKKMVHDILSEKGIGPRGETMQRRPVAFIQHGNREDGNQYEGICPWCGTTTGYITDINVVGGLYRMLLKAQKEHWTDCEVRMSGKIAREFAVEITTKPLETQKPIVIQ